ncbi:MAG: NAD-dependent epimerase/dehydratase family protein [Acidianus infernus]|nr:NAD-dependent epimerase/dehydratase family protein [Acidianus infernus]
MKYLLLGLGFVSTHVAEYLSKFGEVKVTYKSLNPVKRIYAEDVLKGKAEVVKLDPLQDKEKLKEEISSSDVIVNFIGEIQGSEESLRVANVEIPKLIAQTVGETQSNEGKKKILIHFSGLLGKTGNNVKPEEPHLQGINPSTPFEKTKYEGEKEVYQISQKYDFPLVILRPTLVYGRYSAHIQFITMYNFAKKGIIPRLSFQFNTISAYYIAEMIKNLSDFKGRKYFYATECSPVNVTRFFELMAKGLGINRQIHLYVPEFLAKLVLPSYIKSLLKYTKSTYDCTESKNLVNNLTFDENEVIKNAIFLRRLEKEKSLIPT